ncbi:MAG: hypothetical protein P4L81_07425 [Candidatus Pacebacteria bacterium]|nr:hypothetical protein [Candidatus Paceibacterota bacterium]
MQAFLVFNSVALPIAFGSHQNESVKLLISVFGFFMHLGLVFAAIHSIDLLQFWDDRLAELERLDEESETESGSRVAIFSHQNFWERQEWPRLRAYYFPFGMGVVVWAYEVIVFFQSILE